jgi:hypothetical protein
MKLSIFYHFLPLRFFVVVVVVVVEILFLNTLNLI